MSTTAPASKLISLVERGSDWLNPILVKETRQALKSRQFVATFMLMLVASWLISVFGILLAGAGAEYRPLGGGFFFAYYVVLAVAVFIIVPFGAFRSLLAERDLHTWEVLSITTLKPRQIVWGKLLSALVQIFIYYSAITPFMAFAKLLKGIDVPTIAFVLIMSLAWSVSLAMLALTVSTLGSQRYWQAFLTLAVLGGLLTGLAMTLSTVAQGMQFAFEFDAAEFWWATAIAASFLIAYFVLFLQIAIGQLTFDADNHATGVRLAAAAVFWLALGWGIAAIELHGLWGFPGAGPADVNDFLRAFVGVSALHWLVVGLFTATETDALSRRVRRNLAQSRFGVCRVLLAPVMPGGARGLLYVVFHLAVLLVFVRSVAAPLGGINDLTMTFVAGLLCYVIIYLGLGSLTGRLARRLGAGFRPAHARVAIVLTIALGSILPYLLYFLDDFRNGGESHPQFWVTDPFSTLTRLNSGHPASTLLLLLLVAGAVLALAANLRSICAGIAEVARCTLPAATAPPAKTAAQIEQTRYDVTPAC